MLGEVLLDQLLQLDSDLHFLKDYLVLIIPEQASEFVHFATPTVHEDLHIIKAELANCICYACLSARPWGPTLDPLDNLEKEEHQQSFTPCRITIFISWVRRAKSLEVPRAIKIILFEDFGNHLCEQVRQAYVYTGDLIGMVREAYTRLTWDPAWLSPSLHREIRIWPAISPPIQIFPPQPSRLILWDHFYRLGL